MNILGSHLHVPFLLQFKPPPLLKSSKLCRLWKSRKSRTETEILIHPSVFEVFSQLSILSCQSPLQLNSWRLRSSATLNSWRALSVAAQGLGGILLKIRQRLPARRSCTPPGQNAEVPAQSEKSSLISQSFVFKLVCICKPGPR